MIGHRRLRLLGLAFAAAAVWAVAPGTASANDHRRDRDRFEHRDDRHDRYDRHDRDRHDRHDRWDRHDRRKGPAKHARKHDARRDRHYAWRDDRHEHHRYDRRDHRYDRWDHRYDGWDRRQGDWKHRFHRHDRRRYGQPFWCAHHRVGFHDRGRFDRHLIHDHYVPYWVIPRLVAHVGFGWTFGY